MDTIGFITASARELEIKTCLGFDPRLLVPEPRIRHFCHQNKCGNFGANYMCPPVIGSPREIELRLRGFSRGVLLQYSRPLVLPGDAEGVKQAKLEFHHKVLELEALLRGKGLTGLWGLIGGSCELCDVCKAATDEPCPRPEEARPSLEALAIDVLGLLDRLGLDSEFNPDRITWTGCILL